MTKVLGIDPGFAKLGIAGVEINDGELSLITYNLISNPPLESIKYNEYLERGIGVIADSFPRYIDIVRPEVIYSELVPPGRLGSNSELVMASFAVCRAIAWQFGIPWIGISANTIKKELTGDSKATKSVVKQCVFSLFPKVKERDTKLKKQSKLEIGTSIGLEQDMIDAVGVAVVGARKRENEKI